MAQPRSLVLRFLVPHTQNLPGVSRPDSRCTAAAERRRRSSSKLLDSKWLSAGAKAITDPKGDELITSNRRKSSNLQLIARMTWDGEIDFFADMLEGSGKFRILHDSGSLETNTCKSWVFWDQLRSRQPFQRWLLPGRGHEYMQDV